MTYSYTHSLNVNVIIERMLAVVRWFMSTLYGSYASRCTNGLNEKKPYNPILGEQFKCKLGNVKCVCEQVCHHPPVSAFYLEDEQAGVSLNGHSKLIICLTLVSVFEAE